MENSLVKSILEICKMLNQHGVEYLIVGGTAVGFHGYYRGSTASDGTPLGKHDLDFWYNPTLENYYKLLDAFENFDLQIKNGSSLPSLIFVDLNMPVMNGWDFLEEFTKIYPKDKEMPLIFIMTSSIDVKDLEKAKAYNLEDHYLLKPVTSDVLKRILV